MPCEISSSPRFKWTLVPPGDDSNGIVEEQVPAEAAAQVRGCGRRVLAEPIHQAGAVQIDVAAITDGVIDAVMRDAALRRSRVNTRCASQLTRVRGDRYSRAFSAEVPTAQTAALSRSGVVCNTLDQ